MNLPDNSEALSGIIEESPMPISLYVGREMIVFLANNAIIKAWGKDASVIGKPLREAVPELDGQPFHDILDEVFTSGNIYTDREAEVSLLIGNELKVFYFDFTYKPLKDATGNVWGILNNATDVTELVMARKKVSDSDLRFRKMVEEAPVAIGIFRGEELVVETANKKMLELLDRDTGIINKNFVDAIPEMKDQPYPAIMLEVMRTGNPAYGNEVMAILNRNGALNEGFFNHIYTPLREKDDTISGVMIVASEITDQVKSKLELQESEKRFRSLIEDAPMATALFEGKDLVIKIANQAMFNVWGKGSTVLGKKLIDAVPELSGQPFLQILENVYYTGIAYHADQQKAYLEVGGKLQPFWFNFTYQPLFNEEGEVYAVLDMAVDVSKQVYLQKQKDDFLGIASHELKTPVTSLKAYIQVFEMLIQQEKETDGQKLDMVRNMNNQVNKLTSLIEDLLDVTKIQAGRLQFNDTHFDFNAMIDEVINDMKYTIGKHTIILENKAHGFVYADKERIGQVIANLVSNAVKYSPHADEIIITSHNENGGLHFCVQDFGIGIPEEKKDKVFEQFYRVSGKLQHTFPGLGLGLYISSEIVKHENGRMWVNSVVGKGSTFCFSLPQSPEE